MNVSETFKTTRKPVEDLAMLALWDDLTAQADINNTRYESGKRVKAHKFHVVNSQGYYVNVILDRKNNIKVRGIITNEYKVLAAAIENIND